MFQSLPSLLAGCRWDRQAAAAACTKGWAGSAWGCTTPSVRRTPSAPCTTRRSSTTRTTQYVIIRSEHKSKQRITSSRPFRQFDVQHIGYNNITPYSLVHSPDPVLEFPESWVSGTKSTSLVTPKNKYQSQPDTRMPRHRGRQKGWITKLILGTPVRVTQATFVYIANINKRATTMILTFSCDISSNCYRLQQMKPLRRAYMGGGYMQPYHGPLPAAPSPSHSVSTQSSHSITATSKYFLTILYIK